MAALKYWDASTNQWVTLQGGPKGDPGPPQKFVRDWSRDGVEGVFGVQYWQYMTPGTDGPEHSLSVSGDSLRIGSAAENLNGNRREAWIVSDKDFDDFEILVRIDRPSNINSSAIAGGMTPQTGLMLRGTGVGESSGKAIAMFVNVFGSYGPLNVYNFRPWAVDETGHVDDSGASSAGSVSMSKLTVPIKAAGILSGNIIVVPADGVDSVVVSQMSGQLVDYAPGTITNGITAVNGKTASNIFGLAFDSGGQADKALGFVNDATVKYSDISTSNGTPVPSQAWYPAYLRVRLVGRQMKTKWWHSVLPEPRNWMNTVNLSADAPTKGKIGLVANHMFGADNYIAYGPVEITPIQKLSTSS